MTCVESEAETVRERDDRTSSLPKLAPECRYCPAPWGAERAVASAGVSRVTIRSVRLHNLTFDAGDPVALAAFWAAVLGRPVSEGANEFFATIERTATEPALLFIRVPEAKTAKNRMHVDLDCDDLASARQRLEALGAQFVHEKDEFGVQWLTFRDPEGNEFCVASHR